MYRLVMASYTGAAILLPLTFACAFVGITLDGDPYAGLALLFAITGILLLGAGITLHSFAVSMYKDLEPLPREDRRRNERIVREKRADAELARSLKEVEDRTLAIEGKVSEPRRESWEPPDVWR